MTTGEAWALSGVFFVAGLLFGSAITMAHVIRFFSKRK